MGYKNIRKPPNPADRLVRFPRDSYSVANTSLHFHFGSPLGSYLVVFKKLHFLYTRKAGLPQSF